MTSVTCTLSLTATATAKEPPSAYSPTIHSRLVCDDPKSENRFKGNNFETAKKTQICKGISNPLFDQKSPVHRKAPFPSEDRQILCWTLQLINWISLGAYVHWGQLLRGEAGVLSWRLLYRKGCFWLVTAAQNKGFGNNLIYYFIL